jgi:hypothetical protein
MLNRVSGMVFIGLGIKLLTEKGWVIFELGYVGN